MSTVYPGACWAPRAAECRLYVDGAETSRPCTRSLLPASWKGSGSYKTLLPASLSYSNCSALRERKMHLANPLLVATTVRCNLKSDPQVLETWSMDETYDALANRLFKATKTTDPSGKYIVGLAGPPGAGKSTVANEVVARLNKLWREERSQTNEMTDIAVAVPMDGFHLYRWQLDAMEDPAEAHARRGAPWTFDPVGLVDCLCTLRKKGSVSLPSFDHGVGDPVENDIYVDYGHRVVLVEGNYVLLKEGAWSDLGTIFDERWFVQIDLDEAMDRVERRHVLTGKPPEVAKWRVAHNDRPNAEIIQESKWNADLLIQSIPLTISDPVL